MNMNAIEYKAITDYVFHSCGIVLGEDKEYLVKQRLTPILPALGCNDLSDLARILMSGSVNFVVREKVVNAMTTNETSWFRDGHPFDAFRDKILPDMKKKNAYLIAQDEESSVVFGMPRAAAATGLLNKVASLANIPDAVLERIHMVNR